MIDICYLGGAMITMHLTRYDCAK